MTSQRYIMWLTREGMRIRLGNGQVVEVEWNPDREAQLEKLAHDWQHTDQWGHTNGQP